MPPVTCRGRGRVLKWQHVAILALWTTWRRSEWSLPQCAESPPPLIFAVPDMAPRRRHRHRVRHGSLYGESSLAWGRRRARWLRPADLPRIRRAGRLNTARALTKSERPEPRAVRRKRTFSILNGHWPYGPSRAMWRPACRRPRGLDGVELGDFWQPDDPLTGQLAAVGSPEQPGQERVFRPVIPGDAEVISPTSWTRPVSVASMRIGPDHPA